jgi:hypothetical protein
MRLIQGRWKPHSPVLGKRYALSQDLDISSLSDGTRKWPRLRTICRILFVTDRAVHLSLYSNLQSSSSRLHIQQTDHATNSRGK